MIDMRNYTEIPDIRNRNLQKTVVANLSGEIEIGEGSSGSRSLARDGEGGRPETGGVRKSSRERKRKGRELREERGGGGGGGGSSGVVVVKKSGYKNRLRREIGRHLFIYLLKLGEMSLSLKKRTEREERREWICSHKTI